MCCRRGLEGGELAVEEGERRGGERGVLGLGVGVGEEQTGDRVLARAGDWDRLGTGWRERGGSFTGRRNFFFHVFAPVCTLPTLALVLVLCLLRDRAGHLPAAPVQVLFLQRLDLLRSPHLAVVLVLVDLRARRRRINRSRSSSSGGKRAPVPPVPDPVFTHVEVGPRSPSAGGLFVPDVFHGRQDVSGLASAGEPVLGDPRRTAGDGLVGAHDVLEGVYGAVLRGGGHGGGGGGHLGGSLSAPLGRIESLAGVNRETR